MDASENPWADVELYLSQIAYRLANAPLRIWPFPHLEVEHLLPERLFQAVRLFDLAQHLVSRRDASQTPPPGLNPARFFRRLVDADRRPIATDSFALNAAVAALCHNDTAQVLIGRFRPVIAQRFDGQIPLTYTTVEYLDDRTGYELLPHTDVPQKLVTLLLYLAEDDADSDLGTALYRPRSGRKLGNSTPTSRHYAPDDMLEVYRVPYRPNRALVFAPTANSLHGVPRVDDPTHPRRLLQCQINAVLGSGAPG